MKRDTAEREKERERKKDMTAVYIPPMYGKSWRGIAGMAKRHCCHGQKAILEMESCRS